MTQASAKTVSSSAKKPARKKVVVNAAQKRSVGQIIAALSAAFLPIASYVIAHFEMKGNPYLVILVIAALAFSAPTLVHWATKWCGNVYKAIGYTVLLEGVMILSGIQVLSYCALGILSVINCYAAYSNFGEAQRKKNARKVAKNV